MRFLREFYQLNIFNLKPFGLADLTASTVLDVVPHSTLWRNANCRVAAATSTSAQFNQTLK